MSLVDSLVSAARRAAAYDAYLEGRSNATSRARQRFAAPGVSAHWLGLCDALSSDYLSNGVLLPAPALWAELSPFLLVPDEDRAAGLLLEYVSYKVRADSADIELLGVEINRALHRLDVRDSRILGFLGDAMTVYRPAWLALLSFETYRWAGRALAAAKRVPAVPARTDLVTG